MPKANTANMRTKAWLKDTSFYVMQDEYDDTWIVFGNNSNFAYSTHDSKQEAKNAASLLKKQKSKKTETAKPDRSRLEKLTTRKDYTWAQRAFQQYCSSDNMSEFHDFMRELDDLLMRYSDKTSESDTETEEGDEEIDLPPEVNTAIDEVVAELANVR